MKLEQFCLWTQSCLSQQPLSSLWWHYIMHLNYPGEVNSCVAFVFCYKSQVKKTTKKHIFYSCFYKQPSRPSHSMMSFQCKGLRVEADRRLYCGGVLRSWEKAAGSDNRGGFLGLGALGGTEESSSSGIWRSGGAGRWSGGGGVVSAQWASLWPPLI